MTRTQYLNGLPLHKFGPNKGRLNRSEATKITGLTTSQLHKAYNNWNMLFRKPGTNITFIQYLNKMMEANITPDDLGNSLENYHLSRYNDEGPYTNESCRFITKRENLQEQKKVSPYAKVVSKYGEAEAKRMNAIAGRQGGIATKQKHGRMA